MRKLASVVVRAVVLGLLVLAGTSAASCAPRDWQSASKSWRAGDALPSFPLVDEHGRAFPLSELAGKPLLVGFVFTRCTVADACPMTMSRIAQVQEQASFKHVDMRELIVTLDPAHDNADALAAYGRKFHIVEQAQKEGAGATLATGDAAVIDALTSLFNVIAVAQNGTLAHPIKVALLDAHLKPQREWVDNRFTAQEVVDAAAAF